MRYGVHQSIRKLPKYRTCVKTSNQHEESSIFIFVAVVTRVLMQPSTHSRNAMATVTNTRRRVQSVSQSSERGTVFCNRNGINQYAIH